MPMMQPLPYRAMGMFTSASEAGLPSLSQDFFHRLLHFVSWERGWDGESAAPIPASVAEKALKLAKASLAVASEPFIAPADASLLLRWDMPTGEVVELFIDEQEIEALAVIHNHEVREIEASGTEGVLTFLCELANGSGASLRR